MFRYSRILLPTDFSYCSFYAGKYAVAIARRYNAALHLVHVVDTAPLLPWASPSYWLWSDCLCDREACLCEHSLARLRHVVHLLRREGIEADCRVLRGHPAAEIAQVAHDMACELVVAGTHGRTGMEHALLGSVSEEIARRSPVPVLTIKHPEHEFVEFRAEELQMRRVMFPTDFSPYSRTALPYAASLCRESHATLVLFHAIELPVYGGELMADAVAPATEDSERDSHDRLAEMAEEYPGISVEVRQDFGSASHEIVRAVESLDIDLIVIPTHGRTGVARLLFGGVAQKVLRFAGCPVLTVRPDMVPVRQTVEELAAAGISK